MVVGRINKTGMEISTIGYPLGTDPLIALGKLSQMGPFIRRGIISSDLALRMRIS
jgi:hypothetical protein